MLENYRKREKEHLFRLISRRNNSTPNFALLIGAGASVTSGVKPACQMIAEWRQQLFTQSKSDEPLEKWLQKQSWYNDDEEYGILFEKVCDQPSQRRTYIEECIKFAKPSWGYIYLANLILHNYFNVVFTPNFDDLLNESCLFYADCKPIVCAHDSAVAGIRVTSDRPKIIKLHGDFLYDSIRNTLKETDILEKNMQNKLLQFSREYGLVVVGYGGNDKSIMDILDTMLRQSESEQYFPNGLYWCMRKGDKISRKLDRLLQRENTFLVEIDGFDEFMAELHEFLGLKLPNFVRDPYQATTEKLNRFVSQEGVVHPVIKKHIRELNEQMKKFEQAITQHLPSKELSRLIPYPMLIHSSYMQKKYHDVIKYADKAIIQSPDDYYLMVSITWSYLALEKPEKGLEFAEKVIRIKPSDYYGYCLKSLVFIYIGKYKEAEELLEEAFVQTKENSKDRATVYTNMSHISLLENLWESALDNAEKALKIDPDESAAICNKCIALKKLGKVNEANKIMNKTLTKIDSSWTGKYNRACSYAVLEDKENMLKELSDAIKEDTYFIPRAKMDPEFEVYRMDPDFRKLVYKE